MKVITDFFTSIGEERAPGQIPPKELDSIMARFFLGVLKKDGTKYEPDSLSSMYNSLERHEISNRVCTDIFVIQNSKHSS
jgi:hypothetical protein